jgi:hypothetical protein
VASFALGLAAVVLVTTSDHEADPPACVASALTLGFALAGAGVYPCWRRPPIRSERAVPLRNEQKIYQALQEEFAVQVRLFMPNHDVYLDEKRLFGGGHLR